MKRIYQQLSSSYTDQSPRVGLVSDETSTYNGERPSKLRKLSPSTDGTLELDLSGSCNLTPNLLQELSLLVPNLLSINLSCCNYLGDEDILILFSGLDTSPSQFSIQQIDLSHTQITDEGIKLIALKCPRLTTINLKGCLHITDMGLSLVSQYCKNLSHLVIADCARISDTGVQLVAQEAKQQLVLLDLNDCTQITDKTLAYLGYYCPNLSYLRLKNTSATSLMLTKLLPRVRITELNVQGVAGINDKFLFLLSRFQQANLKRLDVSFCYQVSMEGINKVASEADLLSDVSLFGLSLPHTVVLRLQIQHPTISFFT